MEQLWPHYMYRRCCPVHICSITEGWLQIIMSLQQRFNWSLIYPHCPQAQTFCHKFVSPHSSSH